MKKNNTFFNIILVVCTAVMLVFSLYWIGKYLAIEEELAEVHNTSQYEIQSLEQRCKNLLTHNTALEATLEESQTALENANVMIEAFKSEKYAVAYTVTEKEIEMIAKTIWGEARGVNTFQQSMVVWCILNRVDSGKWGNTVAEVITAHDQFHGYSSRYPVTEEHKALAQDVVARWQMEKFCYGDVGRTLPSEYLYFQSDGTGLGNIFRTQWRGNYEVWDPSNCYNPYS